ncbi:MAG: magnesium chelatase, partial [Actinobacteria bacterium]|nr:magnesium chelatase [Actinomycetota bacterium]
LDGKRERVAPDRELLTGIAQSSGGQAFSAESLDQLNKVYNNIRSEVGQTPVKKETTALWAGYGLAFAVVAALAAVSLGARWP